MQFGLLGELEVLVDGSPVPVGAAKQRALLALLLLERGQAVSTDRLIDAIWSGRPPETAQKSIQVYVSGLRKESGPDRIVTRERGYELVVAPGETDVERFDELVRAGRFDDALQLVRGRPLADVALEPWAAPEVDRLEEKILAATEARIRRRPGARPTQAPRSRAGKPRRVASLPRAPARALDAGALSIRTAGGGARGVPAGAPRFSRDELGLEPGRSLQQLQTAILQQDPALDPPAGARTLARRRRRWKLITAGAAAVLVAAAAATAIALTRGGSGSLESLPPGRGCSLGERRLARLPHFDDGDPAAGRGGGRKRPLLGLGPKPFQLVEIDPSDGRVLRHVGSPFGGDAAWYLPDGRYVWLTAGRELVRVEAAEGRVVDRYKLTNANAEYVLNWVTRCFGSLWVTDNPDNLVLRVDPGERPR